MRSVLILCVVCCILISCKENTSSTTSTKNTRSTFEITGTIEASYINKVYLHSIRSNSLSIIDSAVITDKSFHFEGHLPYPSRHALAFSNDPTIVTFILENKSIAIDFEKDNLENPVISGSPLNTEFAEYAENVRSIFKQIDALYPEFQRARLENDVTKLDAIAEQMKTIENSYLNYSFDFIAERSTSYVAPIILNDLIHIEQIDTLRIRKAYMGLSEQIKKSNSVQQIAEFLELP